MDSYVEALVLLVPLVLFIVLSFWTKQPVLFLIGGALSLIVALHWPDYFNSSTLSYTEALAFIAYWIVSWCFALIYMFYPPSEE